MSGECRLKVSIILPVYNTERYLAECVESLLKQTYSRIEILIIDDGSTDGSGKMADSYQARDGRVKVYHQLNGGLSNARNSGIEHATGDILMYVDSDDYVAPDYVEKLVNAMECKNTDMAMCSYYRLFQNRCLPDSKMPGEEKLIEPMEYLESFYCYPGSYAVVWNKAYRRDIFQQLKFQEGSLNEDSRIMPDIVSSVDKIAYIPEQLYYYRRRSGSIMGGDKEQLALSELSWLSYHINRYRSTNQEYLLHLAQKLYISKIVENLQYMQGETRKNVRKSLNAAMREFLKSREFGVKVKGKYVLAAMFPDIYGKQFMKGKDSGCLLFE